MKHQLSFLVVGAYALAVHGRPRATGDLDIWVDATPDNAMAGFLNELAAGTEFDAVFQRFALTPYAEFQSELAAALKN